MAFATKTDYSGLTSVTALSSALTIRDDNPNATNEKYQPVGQDGSFLSTEVFGEDAAPVNNFGLGADITLAAGDIKLNKVTTVDAKKYALESIQISTSGGSAVSISATSQLIEDSASDPNQCHYSVPALSVLKKHHAQILFSAFTLAGSGCSLTECSATIGSSVGKDKVAGNIISSDVGQGVITITGTVIQTGATSPTITAADGWTVTQLPSCENPETAYKSWKFEVQKILQKDAVTI